MKERGKEENQAIYFHELTLQEDPVAVFSISSLRVIKMLNSKISLYVPSWGLTSKYQAQSLLLQVATTSADNNKFRNWILSQPSVFDHVFVCLQAKVHCMVTLRNSPR